jgi:hypothetical protein
VGVTGKSSDYQRARVNKKGPFVGKNCLNLEDTKPEFKSDVFRRAELRRA